MVTFKPEYNDLSQFREDTGGPALKATIEYTPTAAKSWLRLCKHTNYKTTLKTSTTYLISYFRVARMASDTASAIKVGKFTSRYVDGLNSREIAKIMSYRLNKTVLSSVCFETV